MQISRLEQMAVRSKKAEENIKLLKEKQNFLFSQGGQGWPRGLHVASGDLWGHGLLWGIPCGFWGSGVALGVTDGLVGLQIASGAVGGLMG
jgi:hypothetical protein